MKIASFLLITLPLLSSCKENSTAGNPAVPTAMAPSAALTGILAAPPSGTPVSIQQARTTAKPGDEITLSGRIMGNAKPFVEGRSVFILGDPSILTPCNELPGDNCEAPWDTCCETPEDKKRGTATIQVVGSDGRVLKESMEGVGGLKNLASITVTGKVAEGSSPELLIVNAVAIRAGK